VGFLGKNRKILVVSRCLDSFETKLPTIIPVVNYTICALSLLYC